MEVLIKRESNNDYLDSDPLDQIVNHKSSSPYKTNSHKLNASPSPGAGVGAPSGPHLSVSNH